MTQTEITIHTDGSCLGNPGPGGFGAILRRYEDGTEVKKLVVSGHHRTTTNNQMELLAALRGLQRIKRDEPAQITVMTDSKYLVEGMTKWVHGWQRKEWRKADGKEVLNRSLWEELAAVCNGLQVTWQWVRGHNGDENNEEADALAKAAAAQAGAGRAA
jgi:ribonuclease HI